MADRVIRTQLSMAKYLYRSRPRCSDYLGVVVPEPVKEVPINAYCLRCGFKLDWKVVVGKRVHEGRSETINYRTPKALFSDPSPLAPTA